MRINRSVVRKLSDLLMLVRGKWRARAHDPCGELTSWDCERLTYLDLAHSLEKALLVIDYGPVIDE